MATIKTKKPAIKHKRKFVLSIEEFDINPVDFTFMQEQYKYIRQMHKLASLAPQDLKPIFVKEIKAIRQTLQQDYAFKGWEYTLSLGSHQVTEMFVELPNANDLKQLRNDLLEKISKLRRDRTFKHLVTKDFQGLRYLMEAPQTSSSPRIVSSGMYDNNIEANADQEEETPLRRVTGTDLGERVGPDKILPGFVGGGAVFTKPGSILKLMKSNEYGQRIRRAKRPYDNANYVGVELELITKVSRERLELLFVAARLAGSVYIKHDGSIRTEQVGDITHEVTLIAKEQNIYDVISRVCAVLNGADVNSYVNNSCGLHVHVDMRNRDPELCYGNFKNSLNILAGMVPPDRVDSDHGRDFCALECNGTFREALEEGGRNRRARYRAINAQSYSSHQTLEVRLHSGSTNAMKINNWVKLLLAITNSKTPQAFCYTPEALQQAYGFDKDLLDYIVLRTEKFKNRSLDTRKDHFETAI